ncbi:MAG: lysine--tRNA ligase, partial [Candidatus Bathyarchaeota archaeon]
VSKDTGDDRLSGHRIRHWSEVIAQEIIAKQQEPYVIASGITTSGPTHMGTVCEFLYPSAIVTYLKEQNHPVEFVFIGDVMDAFDSVPKPLSKFTALNDHLGKPLCDVPDPFNCCESYGGHFLHEIVTLMGDLEITATIHRTDDLIETGRYDFYATHYHKNQKTIEAIAAETARLSGTKKTPEWVDIVMPICENCGKIATTRILSFDGYVIRYACDKAVGYTQGCDYVGNMHIAEHRYKLFWRLDWPARQDFLHVSAELAGVDHHTRGGSWDTAVAIHREILERTPPVSYRFGFVLLHGRKYSKSKGIGLSVQELLSFVPPPLIKYKLFKTDISENKEFDPSGNALIRLYEEYTKAANLYETTTQLHRAEDKLALAYALSTNKRRWQVEFTDLLTQYQIYENWDQVADRTGDREGVMYLRPYVENWVTEEYLPEAYVFRFQPNKVEIMMREIETFATRLSDGYDDKEVHNLVYHIAQEQKVPVTSFFRTLYRTLIAKDHGPRFGKLVVAIGVARVKKHLLQLYSRKTSAQ